MLAPPITACSHTVIGKETGMSFAYVQIANWILVSISSAILKAGLKRRVTVRLIITLEVKLMACGSRELAIYLQTSTTTNALGNIIFSVFMWPTVERRAGMNSVMMGTLIPMAPGIAVLMHE